MRMYEAQLTDSLQKVLIEFSEDWEKERSCHGYRANGRTDIEGNRIFIAEDGGQIIGYLFGNHVNSKNSSSIMPEGTPCFEVEELYIIPSRRNSGIGSALFRFVEEQVKDRAEYFLLSTATKNYRAILHFYIDEVGMQFWSARLFKKL